MMRETRTYGEIKNGAIHYTKLKEFKESTLVTFKEGERFHVIHQKFYKKRSTPQNNYWYGIIIEYALQGYKDANGHDLGVEFTNEKTGEVFNFKLPKNEQIRIMHEMLLAICNLDDDGNVRRSHENSTTQQEEMHQSARDYIKFAYGLNVPLPGEQGTLEFDK